jgi:hypothetical protein
MKHISVRITRASDMPNLVTTHLYRADWLSQYSERRSVGNRKIRIKFLATLKSALYYIKYGRRRDRWYTVEHLAEALRYKPEGRGFDSWSCYCNNGPVPHSASKRNEYQEYFLCGKGGRYKRWQLYYFHVQIVWQIVWQSGSVDLLESSRPVQGLLYQ